MIRENVNERCHRDRRIGRFHWYHVCEYKVREQRNVETKEQSGTNYNVVKFFCLNSGREGNGRMIRVEK